MNYTLLNDLISRLEAFENHPQKANFTADIEGFENWLYEYKIKDRLLDSEPDWEGKTAGRSPESVINTLIVHMNQYAQSYSKSAIFGSDFSTQSEFIYLINLKVFGRMTKIELIKKNLQDKSAGTQTIKRLIKKEWVEQVDSETDKRSKLIHITQKGMEALETQMQKIREATKIVTGDLTYAEKMELIRLLTKLDEFHQNIYHQNLGLDELLEFAYQQYKKAL